MKEYPSILSSMDPVASDDDQRRMLVVMGDHTYIGGADSLLFRAAEDLDKALSEIERLWRRHGR